MPEIADVDRRQSVQLRVVPDHPDQTLPRRLAREVDRGDLAGREPVRTAHPNVLGQLEFVTAHRVSPDPRSRCTHRRWAPPWTPAPVTSMHSDQLPAAVP